MPVGPNSRTGRTTILAWIAAAIAVAATIGILTVSGYIKFSAAVAPSGSAGETRMWHDSTTDRLMENMANGGAKYVCDTGGFTADQLLKATDVGTLEDATNTDTQVAAAVSASHARSHAITGTSDHTSTATSGQMLKADANGLPIDATNTDTAVASAVSASHVRSHAITGTSDHTSTATANVVLKGDANGLPVDSTITEASGVVTVNTAKSTVDVDVDFLAAMSCVNAQSGLSGGL